MIDNRFPPCDFTFELLSRLNQKQFNEKKFLRQMCCLNLATLIICVIFKTHLSSTNDEKKNLKKGQHSMDLN